MKPAEAKLRDYLLLRELGRGGMAIVYEAIETSIARPVAIKMLPAAAALDSRQSSRFRLEAQVAASLDHPRIVPVYTVGDEDQAIFYVMKFIDGRSLAAVVEEMDSSGNENFGAAHMCNVAQWGLQAADALSYTHARGIVHGDVKPANLLLDQSGDLWLSDFGAMRLAASQSQSPESSTAGTIRYLSPEQARGDYRNIDHRSDVYALGATLFELATLRPAVLGVNSSELIGRIATGSLPQSSAWPKRIPARLREIILRAMAADVNSRYATADELAEDLRCFLQPQPTSAGRLRSRIGSDFVRRKWIAIATAGILALALGLVGFTSFARQSAAFNLAQNTAVGQQATQRLKALTQYGLNQLADKLARGMPLTEEESQLFQFGPSTDFLLEVHDRELLEQTRFELAKVLDRLAMLHGWTFEFAEQETILIRAVEQWEALIQQQPFPDYVASAAFSQLMLCELYTQTGRIQESVELSRQAIGQLETLYQSDPDDYELAVVFAYALTRLDLSLSEIVPPEESERHRQSVFRILESLPVRSDETPSLLGEMLGQSDRLQLPSLSLRDALAECCVNLAFLVPDLNQTEKYLRTALEELADSDVTDSVAGRHNSLIARGKQVLGRRLMRESAEGRTEAELLLQQSTALFQQLVIDSPQIVVYRVGLALALGTLGECQALAGDAEEGKLHMAQAADLLKALTVEFPDQAEFHHRLAGILNNLGNFHSSTESLATYEEAMRHESIAIRLSPTQREHRRWLAKQINNLAAAYSQSEDPGKAESVWRAAIENAARLAELTTASYDDSHQQAHNWLGLGECLMQQAEHEQEAADALRTATDLFRSLFLASGRKPHDACMLAATYSAWGQLL